METTNVPKFRVGETVWFWNPVLQDWRRGTIESECVGLQRFWRIGTDDGLFLRAESELRRRKPKGE